MATPTSNFNLLKPTTGETYNVQTTNDNYDKIDTALQNQSVGGGKQALGLLQKKRITGSAAAPSTTLAVIDNFASVSLKANRHYRVNWHVNNYTGSTAGTYITATINLAPTADAAAAVTNLTNVESNTLACVTANTAQSSTVTGYIDPTADTTIQIKFTAQVAVGTAGAMSAYVCTIEDLGAQF